MEIFPARYETADMIHRLVNFISESARKKSLAVIVDVDEALPSALLGDDMSSMRSKTMTLLLFTIFSQKSAKKKSRVNLREMAELA